MPSQRYFATLKGQKEPTPIDIEALPGGRYILTVGDRRHEVDALVLKHGAVSMLIDSESYSLEFEDHEDIVGVMVKNQVTRIDVANERRMRLRAVGGQFAAEGKQTIVAPMPGKVVKVLVNVGDEVTEGQGIVIVEAMKMENELKSPKAGKVVEVVAKEGAPVEMNAKLAVIE